MFFVDFLQGRVITFTEEFDYSIIIAGKPALLLDAGINSYANLATASSGNLLINSRKCDPL